MHPNRKQAQNTLFCQIHLSATQSGTNSDFDPYISIRSPLCCKIAILSHISPSPRHCAAHHELSAIYIHTLPTVRLITNFHPYISPQPNAKFNPYIFSAVHCAADYQFSAIYLLRWWLRGSLTSFSHISPYHAYAIQGKPHDSNVNIA